MSSSKDHSATIMDIANMLLANATTATSNSSSSSSSTTNPSWLDAKGTLGVAMAKNAFMFCSYATFIVLVTFLLLKGRQPVKIHWFLPIICSICNLLQYPYLMARDSIEYVYLPGSNGRTVGYAVIDHFWLFVLGPLFTLATILPPLHYFRYAVLVRWFHSTQQTTQTERQRNIETKANGIFSLLGNINTATGATEDDQQLPTMSQEVVQQHQQADAVALSPTKSSMNLFDRNQMGIQSPIASVAASGATSPIDSVASADPLIDSPTKLSPITPRLTVSFDNNAQRKKYVADGAATPIGTINTIDAKRERTIKLLRKISSDWAFFGTYVVIQCIVSAAFIILLALDYWAKVLPPRTAYTVGVIIQNALGYVLLWINLIECVIAFIVHLVMSKKALKDDQKNFKGFMRYAFSFVFDEPYFFNLDAFLLIPTLVIGFIIVVDRITRTLPHPILEIIAATFDFAWMFSVSSGASVIIALVYWYREKKQRANLRKVWKEKNAAEGSVVGSSTGSGVTAVAMDRLLNCVKNKSSYEQLEAYCRKEFSHENLWCLREIMLYNSLSAHKEKVRQYMEIYALYIQSSSAYEVNIDSKTRDNLPKPDRLATVELTNLNAAVKSLEKVIISNLLDTYGRFEMHTKRS